MTGAISIFSILTINSTKWLLLLLTAAESYRWARKKWGSLSKLLTISAAIWQQLSFPIKPRLHPCSHCKWQALASTLLLKSETWTSPSFIPSSWFIIKIWWVAPSLKFVQLLPSLLPLHKTCHCRCWSRLLPWTSSWFPVLLSVPHVIYYLKASWGYVSKQKSKPTFQWLCITPGKNPILSWAFHTPVRLSYFQFFKVTMFFLMYVCLYVIMLFLLSGTSYPLSLPFTRLTPTHTLSLDLDATSSRKLQVLAKFLFVRVPALQSLHLAMDFSHLFNCLPPNHSVCSMKAGTMWVYFSIIV